MSDTASDPRIEWLRRVLGVAVGTDGSASSNGPASSVLDVPVRPSVPTGTTQTYAGSGGRTLAVTMAADGRVSLAAPPPPVRELTFSGGGGKGAALAGAVAALQASGTLEGVTTLNGASIGSMTAALLAAGITSDDFQAISNDPTTGERISDGRSKVGLVLKGLVGDRLDGKAIEDIVREQMGDSVRKRIADFVAAGTGSPADVATAQAIAEKTAHGVGVTFGDLRTLSKFIPEIKELNVSATMLGDDTGSPGTITKGKPQLMMLSADTEPDLDVAVAVHASAALPPVFDPVNIRLASLGGATAQFEDGGVLNNAPSKALVGAERQLDPIPASSALTFVFEDDAAHQMLKGEATPARELANDFFAKANFSAASYAQNRALADRPEDVVMVPLTFTAPDNKKKDFTGLISGTLAMNMDVADKLQLQANTALATLQSLDRRKLPQPLQFDSADQMLMSISRDDLAALAKDGFAGAREALDFRDTVTQDIAALQGIAADAAAADLASGPVRAALDALNGLAGADTDRVAFVARELNRGGLDALMDLARQNGTQGLTVLAGGVVVADSLRARSVAQTVLREVVYPKMVDVKPQGVDGTVLAAIDDDLRHALTPDDVNAALDIGIAHFAKRVGLLKRPRDQDVAKALADYRMTA